MKKCIWAMQVGLRIQDCQTKAEPGKDFCALHLQYGWKAIPKDPERPKRIAPVPDPSDPVAPNASSLGS